ncbi:MAG: site-specific integrase [Ekhidna sp.]|nr:site-specific integrase [Ekhidna sp.]
MKGVITAARNLQREGQLEVGAYFFILFFICFATRREEGRSILKKNCTTGPFLDVQGISRMGVRVILTDPKTATFQEPDQVITRHCSQGGHYINPVEIHTAIKKHHRRHPNSPWLLQDKKGKPWSDTKIRIMLDKICDRVVRVNPAWDNTFFGIHRKKRVRLFTLQSFRATMICLMLAWGWQVQQIQLITRHKSDASTMHYLMKCKRMSFATSNRASDLHNEAISKLLDDLNMEVMVDFL